MNMSNSYQAEVQRIITIVLDQELKCVACHQCAISPIYSCLCGALVCGICYESFTGCIGCNGQLVASPLAERLAEKYQISLICRNADMGCQLFFRSRDMMAHLVVCPYRNNSRVITCFEMKNGSCGGEIFNLDDFAQHLIMDHGCHQVRRKNLGWTVNFYSHRTFRNQGYYIVPSVLFEFDGKSFVLHEIHNNSVLYRWMSVIGGEEDDRGDVSYIVTIKMSARKQLWNPFSINPFSKTFEWVLPVGLIQHQKTDQFLLDVTQFARINFHDLSTICEESTYKGVSYPYRWVTHIEITKLN